MFIVVINGIPFAGYGPLHPHSRHNRRWKSGLNGPMSRQILENQSKIKAVQNTYLNNKKSSQQGIIQGLLIIMWTNSGRKLPLAQAEFLKMGTFFL